MVELAMFPLESLLFPYMPVPLRVFEDRYLIMLSRILKTEPSEFGVVLIERGHEVGGGEARFAVGTVAQIAQLETSEEGVGLIAQGGSRIEVLEWLADDPYPRANVRVLDELVWDAALAPLRDRTEQAVRRALAVASEFVDQPWSATVELSDDPVATAWQLAAIAPLGPMDQLALLRSTSMRELLVLLLDAARSMEEIIRSTATDEG